MKTDRLRYWLGSLTGQIILVALCALVLVQLISLQIYRLEREEALGLVNSRFTLQRLMAVTRLLRQSPPELHREILRASRSESLLLTLSREAPDTGARNTRLEQLVRTRLNQEPGLAVYISADTGALPPHPEGRRHPPHGHRPDIRLQGGIELRAGLWLRFTSLLDEDTPGWSPKTILSLVLLAALLTGLMVWLLQRTTRPLKQLSRRAERLGRGDWAGPLAETGPSEIRDTLHAFNRMQERLDRFVTDRTRMLAAISHDLRTPLTALQLRCEFLPEGEDKYKLQQGLKRMEQMLRATLQFARDDGQHEPVRDLDLSSLVQSLCDDLQDAGCPVTLEECEPILCRGRSQALRRALQNLLENGVRYGERVEVRLLDSPEHIRILIRDFGPGIPDEQLEEVFKPFTRLDSARNLDDGSIGLGLAIARTLLHQHGGELHLGNHPGGGLLATVLLPH